MKHIKKFKQITESIEKDDDKNPFLLQTANDYDMSYEEVERIYKKYPNSFYEELENYIKNRSNENVNDIKSYKQVEKTNENEFVNYQGKYYDTEKIHIDLLRVGDTILHNGEVKTISGNNLKRGGFMGTTVFGDSYNSGNKKVTLIRKLKLKVGWNLKKI
jgi:hypothetical protein